MSRKEHKQRIACRNNKTAYNKTSFNEQCYALLRRILKGKVTTYKDLAQAMGTRAYRAVGNAMHTNPYAPRVPCHRVVKSDGSIGGFASGTKRKMQMLAAEGIKIREGKIVDFDRVRHRF